MFEVLIGFQWWTSLLKILSVIWLIFSFQHFLIHLWRFWCFLLIHLVPQIYIIWLQICSKIRIFLRHKNIYPDFSQINRPFIFSFCCEDLGFIVWTWISTFQYHRERFCSEEGRLFSLRSWFSLKFYEKGQYFFDISYLLTW